MKKTHRLKAILASLLVTTALAAPAAVLSSAETAVDAELYFAGVSLEMLPDGSVQAIFEVSVDKARNCNGASFILDYNPEYFTPSYIDGTVRPKNTPFVTSTSIDDDGFFAYDRTLYKPEVNPFQEEVEYTVFDETSMQVVTKTSKYSAVTINDHRISMDLWFDRDKLTETTAVGKLIPLKDVGFDRKTALVLNKYDPYDKNATDNVTAPERVALGRLSFRVNPDRLDEIARYFPQPASRTETAEVRMDNGKDTYLIRTTAPEAGETAYRDSWQIGVYQSEHASDDWSKVYYRANPNNMDDAAGLAKRYYELAVDPKQIMRVRPAEKEVTINAYEAFTKGDWGDVAEALRRYSPMATVTYVDGTQENLVIPWGETGDDYEYAVEVKGADGTFRPADWTTDPANPDPAYVPTHGVYRVTQYVPGKHIHPIPITVTLTVTPIRLLDVQVERQTLTYDLDLVATQVVGPGDLDLPEQARLITDIVPSGVSMVMKIPGWTPEKGKWPVSTGSNATTLMNDLKEDSFGTPDAPTGSTGFDGDTMPYWPAVADLAAIGRDEYWRFLKQKNGNWIGEYTFHMAESFGGARKPKFTKAEIQAEFPWLTVDNEDGYPVPDALRQIVTGDSATNSLSYTASYVSTTLAANGQPELTLAVQRNNAAMAEGSIFRVWLPNGQELGTGLTVDVWPDTRTEVDDWFPEDEATKTKNGSYATAAQGDDSNRSFHLISNPGDPETGVYTAERETLRRYINLGGWYYVAVCEDPVRRTWSDPMPVFVPARPNEYQSDKVYNFVGENTELFHWTGELTHYVTMPRGTYTAVTQDGARLYNAGDQAVTLDQMLADKDTYGEYLDDKDRPKTTTPRYELPYGYHTTYDGSTGAQPGTLHSFRVGPTSVTEPGTLWSHTVESFNTAVSAIPPGATIWRYGSDPFYDGADYPGFGKVVQPPAAQTYDVTVRRDQVATKTGRVGITLTSEEPTGITRADPNDMGSNVTLATYDTRTEGYTDRQPYTFKITNIGTDPIYGLAIDGLTDGYSADPTGGRFVMLQPPADFLAPGQSTTFTMTYVYDLKANGAPNPSIYRDTLYVTSSDHPKGGKGADADYLLPFDAQFTVTDEDTHTVTVVVNPGDKSMGDAGLIVGKQGGNMNYTVTTQSYAKEVDVYVAVYMKDEYKLRQDPDGMDAAGNPIPIDEITTANSGITLQPGIRIFHFTMPDYDATVIVNFYEDIFSKLRLSDLIDFSAGTQAELKPNTDPVAAGNTYEVWRKSFTDQERTDAADWRSKYPVEDPEADLYLMTAGTTVPANKGGRQFINTENQYIVVIPYEADWSQVQVKLRQLETHNNDEGDGKNLDITPDVIMHHYGADIRDTWNTTVDVQDKIYEGKGYTAKAPAATPPDFTPSVHVSDIFDSPEPGTSNYVRITASYENESRSYYLEIHRAPREPIATLNYGNSPYGMIMNDILFQRDTPAQTKAAQDMAKEAFRENGYTFDGLEPINVPLLVRRKDNPAVNQNAVYWREAWVHNNQLFEPESLTGFVTTYAPDPNDPSRRIPTSVPDPLVYREEENMDLNDFAFFAILGENMKEPGVAEALDSTGRPVDLEDIRVRVTVTLLDTDAVTQISRFSGEETAELDLGVAGKLLNGLTEPGTLGAAKAGTWPVSSQTTKDPVTGEEATTYTQVEHIRPGLYVMEYVYGDYNGEILTVTRPLVILPAVGDVNCDGAVDSTRRPSAADKDAVQTDEATLKNRVTDPLGYVAGGWSWNAAASAWEETVYPRANILKYRVADVNNDRNVNNIDGNLIDKIARNSAKAIRFYNPVTYVHKGT